LQHPEQLQLKEMLLLSSRAAECGPLPPSAAVLWEQSSECLTLMGSVLVEEQMSRQATCSAETLAAALLRQLEQSGK
jgi:hypothetical protein